ncbi:hypothetical protein ACVGXB_00030, partial [Enterobacter intestinihominis]
MINIVFAFRDGQVYKIKKNAQQAVKIVVSFFRNPGEAVGVIVTKFRGVACGAFARLVSAVRGGGGVIRSLVMSPFALLRA